MGDEKEVAAEVKKGTSKMIVKLVLGLILLALGVGLTILWFSSIVGLIKAVLGPIFILAGTIAVAVARD